MEELELFFKYEKDDNLEEFRLNWEPFIENVEDKINISRYVLKLFQKNLQNLIKEKNELTEELDLIKIRKNIRYNKNIISYLKKEIKQLSKVEEVKPPRKREKNIDVVLKEKKKYHKINEKEKITLTEEEQLLKMKLKNPITRMDCIKNLSDSTLITFIKYYNIKKINYISLKIIARNSNQYDSLDEIQKHINFAKKLLDDLIQEKMIRTDKIEKKLKKPKRFNVPVSELQLQELDQIYQMNIIYTIDKIKELDAKEEKTIEDKEILTSSLNDLISNCTSKIQQLKTIENSQETNIHMNILNNFTNYLKHYQRQNHWIEKKSNYNELVDNEPNKKPIVITNINDYSTEETLFLFGDAIRNNDIDSILSVYKISKDIIQELNHCEIKSDEIIQAIYYIWDSIRYRLTKEPKGNKEIRKLLKDIRILFDFIIKNYKENQKMTKHDYLFDVVNYFLESEDNYLYLKQMTIALPKIVNVKHTIKNGEEKQEEHIVIYIVKCFIQKYRKLLFNKNKHDINVDYLRSVYLLFTRNYHLYLTQEEKRTIDHLLANFTNEVNHSLTSSRRKNRVKEDLKVMYTDKFYMPRKPYLEKKINELRLDNEMSAVSYRMSQSLNHKRVDLTNETVITFGNDFHAYSINQDGPNTILKIHVIDLYNLFLPNTELEHYLFNMTLRKESLEYMLTKMFKMKENETYPTITYEITFDEKGNYKDKDKKILNLNIYQSKVNIKKTYTDYHLTYAKGDIVLKSYLNLYRVSMIKNHGNYDQVLSLQNVDQYFENILNDTITETFEKNKLPFIYSGIANQKEEKYVSIMNHISHILARLSPDDFNKIYQVISKNNDEFHYTLEPFQGSYQFNIINPTNYIGVLLQRIIHEFMIEDIYNEEEKSRILKRLFNEYDEIIATLNYYQDYIDEDVLKSNAGKLIKVKKMLF